MYYRLTYQSTANKDRQGDYVLNGAKPLNIGQGNSCELQLPYSGRYEPQLYASILFNGEQGYWYLVRRTDCFHVQVNGREVAVAQVLNPGDLISFADDVLRTDLKYEVFDDGEYDARSGFVYEKRKNNRSYILTAFLLAFVAVGIAIFALFRPQETDLGHKDLSVYTPSIYRITTDSVYLLLESIVDGKAVTTVVDSVEMKTAAEGTAFLTRDSLFVTARHCVEPWINDEEWDGESGLSEMAPEVRLAAIAETENRTSGQECYRLRAHCIISKGQERYNYNSTDFCMNKSRDMVLKLGTEAEPVYWRSIIPIARRRDMELGDFAYVKVNNMPPGKADALIAMACADEIAALGKSRNHDIAVIGYPLNDNGTEGASVVYGNLMELGDELSKSEGCIRISAPINRGNSGGPVLAQIGTELKIIGIVSKADRRADQGLFWAVPVTEIVNMHSQGDTIENDTVMYRR